MFQAYGYDFFHSNDYIDPVDDYVDHPVEKEEDKQVVQKKESFSNGSMYSALHQKISEQRFQIFCMWILLVVCAIVILNMKGNANHMAQLLYLMQVNSGKLTPTL